MQNAKDTFYEVMRGRLAQVNPARTVVVRGVTRPGLLVDENELVATPTTPDCFRIRWTGVQVAEDGSLPLVTLMCEVVYETEGTAPGAGMDRGRCLAAMDEELFAVVATGPTRALKRSYAALPSGGSVVNLLSTIWWSAPRFGKTELRGQRLRRTAEVTVMCYQEAGEL